MSKQLELNKKLNRTDLKIKNTTRPEFIYTLKTFSSNPLLSLKAKGKFNKIIYQLF